MIVMKAKQLEDRSPNSEKVVISINRNLLEQVSREQQEQIIQGSIRGTIAIGATTIFVMKAVKEWFESRDSGYRESGRSYMLPIGRNQASEFSIPEGLNIQEEKMFLKLCQELKNASPNANLEIIEQQAHILIIVQRMVNSVVCEIQNQNRASLQQRRRY